MSKKSSKKVAEMYLLISQPPDLEIPIRFFPCVPGSFLDLDYLDPDDPDLQVQVQTRGPLDLDNPL